MSRGIRNGTERQAFSFPGDTHPHSTFSEPLPPSLLPSTSSLLSYSLHSPLLPISFISLSFPSSTPFLFLFHSSLPSPSGLLTPSFPHSLFFPSPSFFFPLPYLFLPFSTPLLPPFFLFPPSAGNSYVTMHNTEAYRSLRYLVSFSQSYHRLPLLSFSLT